LDPILSVTKGGTQKLHKNVKIVETYRHDHSLESCGGAVSDCTVKFFDSTISGNAFFSKKPLSLIDVNSLSTYKGCEMFGFYIKLTGLFMKDIVDHPTMPQQVFIRGGTSLSSTLTSLLLMVEKCLQLKMCRSVLPESEGPRCRGGVATSLNNCFLFLSEDNVNLMMIFE
jgi:hypothetical protein